MKHAATYARRVKKLITQMKKDGGMAGLAKAEDALHVLLLGVFSNFTTEHRAWSASQRLLGAMVDVNELRVTPVAEIVETVGVDFPRCRTAAEEIVQVLTSVFNQNHDLDLTFLKTLSKRASTSFLDGLDGLSPCANAFFRKRFLNAHAIPLDQNMHKYLRKSGCLTESADVAEAQKFLVGAIKERDGLSFYAMLKRYAATHSPRKAGPKKKAATKRPTGTVRKKTVKRKPAAGKAAAKKTRTKKTQTKKATKTKAGTRRFASVTKSRSSKKKAVSRRR